MQAETYLIQEREVACIKSFGFLFEEQLKILQITIKNNKNDLLYRGSPACTAGHPPQLAATGEFKY